MSSFIIRILVLLAPGFLASKVYRKLRGRTKKKVWEDFAEVGIFAGAGYAIVAMFSGTAILDAFVDSKIAISWLKVLAAIGVSFILALLASVLHHTRAFNLLALKLGLSYLYGDEEIWEMFQEETETLVYVRDLRHNLIYYGHIERYSRSGQDREVWLQAVDVYDNKSGKKLYDADHIYICLDKTEMTIEIPRAEGKASLNKEIENDNNDDGKKESEKENRKEKI